jgi:hypothetical protein
MLSRLEQLSHELAATHAAMQLARAERQRDAERRDRAGFFAWLADLFGLTAAASAQRRATSDWKVVHRLARDYAVAWVQARTVYLGTTCGDQASTRATLEKRATSILQRVERFTMFVTLVEQAKRHAQKAKAECEAAARHKRRSGTTDSLSDSRRHRISADWRAAAARAAVARTQAVLTELESHIPALTFELRVKIPQGILALIGSSGALGAFMQAHQLRSAAKGCNQAVEGLTLVGSVMREQRGKIQAEHRQATTALAHYDAPFRQRALGELPHNMRALVD